MTAPFVPLVTVEEAANHLREILEGMPDEKADDLVLKISIASQAVVDFLKDRADPEWDETTAPPIVKGAVLHLLGGYWEHRGDDDSAGTNWTEKTWEAIGLMLMRLRDPALR